MLFVPVHSPPHKAVEVEPGVEHRVELCRRAVAGDERLGVSRVEADVEGPSYTVDTLRRLHEQQPEDDLTFIVGGDMARSLPEWREPEAIVALAEGRLTPLEAFYRAEFVGLGRSADLYLAYEYFVQLVEAVPGSPPLQDLLRQFKQLCKL